MKLSCRNQITGKIASISKGPSTSTVKIDIGGGKTITSVITTDAAKDLKLKKGDAVTALVKATSIMIGK